MLAAIALIIICAIGAAVLVITASMLSSRLSRQEDTFLAEEIEREQRNFNIPARETPQSIP